MKTKKYKKRLTKSKKLGLIYGCQASELTVADYAKAHNVPVPTLYRWANIYNISLRKVGNNQKIMHKITPHNEQNLQQEKISFTEFLFNKVKKWFL